MKNIQYVVVNGAPTSGKDTFCNFCLGYIKDTNNGDGEIISSVDFVKEIAYQCGWDGSKTPKNRKFLSDLKDILTNWDNVPFKKILEEAERYKNKSKYSNLIYFVMIREPEEISKFIKETNALTVLILRDINEEISNHADLNVELYDYDYIIKNNKDLTYLKKQAENFIVDVLGFEG